MRLLTYALLLLVLSLSLQAQSVYRGDSRYIGDVICKVGNDRLYKGYNGYPIDIVYTIDGNNIYNGRSNDDADIMLTVDEDEQAATVFKGSTHRAEDVVLTIRFGKVYAGSSSSDNDMLASIWSTGKPGVVGSYYGVYRGDSQASADLLYTIAGQVSLVELVAILWYVGIR